MGQTMDHNARALGWRGVYLDGGGAARDGKASAVEVSKSSTAVSAGFRRRCTELVSAALEFGPQREAAPLRRNCAACIEPI